MLLVQLVSDGWCQPGVGAGGGGVGAGGGGVGAGAVAFEFCTLL